MCFTNAYSAKKRPKGAILSISFVLCYYMLELSFCQYAIFTIKADFLHKNSTNEQ